MSLPRLFLGGLCFHLGRLAFAKCFWVKRQKLSSCVTPAKASAAHHSAAGSAHRTLRRVRVCPLRDPVRACEVTRQLIPRRWRNLLFVAAATAIRPCREVVYVRHPFAFLAMVTS